MPVTIQAQRIPLGTYRTADGREVPVFITVEWYRVMQALAAGVGAATGGTPTTSGSTTTAAANAIDFDNGPPDLDSVIAIELQAVVLAQEVAPDVSRVQADLAALAARVEALEQGR